MTTFAAITSAFALSEEYAWDAGLDIKRKRGGKGLNQGSQPQFTWGSLEGESG